MNRLNETVRSILEAQDEYQAVRGLIGQEMRDFYADTLHYPIGVEFEFERLVVLLRRVDNPKGKLHFAVEIEKLIHGLWRANHPEDPRNTDDVDSKGSLHFVTNDEFDAFRALEEAKKLRQAVSANDQSLVRPSLERLWSDNCVTYDDHFFRKMLAALNGTDFYKLLSFEEYLSSVVSSRRYLGRIEAGVESPPDDLVDSLNAIGPHNRRVDLGVELAKQYLDDRASWMRMPWLTDFLLLLIFDGLLLMAKISLKNPDLFLRFRESRDVALWVTNLSLFCNEIDSHNYDPQELIRRLRHFEDSNGVYVIPSLVYPLLESQS
jgi:hypothetical protein